MMLSYVFKLLITIGLIAAGSAFGGPSLDAFGERDHCDIPGHDLRSFPTAMGGECADACVKDKGCKGYTFVSGWNRCFLKAATPKTFTIRFFSGLVNTTEGKRQSQDERADTDDSGRDLKRVTGTKSAKKCGEACVSEPLCHAYVYIEGYDVCWLKKASGRRGPKIFFCGTKPKSFDDKPLAK